MVFGLEEERGEDVGSVEVGGEVVLLKCTIYLHVHVDVQRWRSRRLVHVAMHSRLSTRPLPDFESALYSRDFGYRDGRSKTTMNTRAPPPISYAFDRTQCIYKELSWLLFKGRVAHHFLSPASQRLKHHSSVTPRRWDLCFVDVPPPRGKNRKIGLCWTGMCMRG